MKSNSITVVLVAKFSAVNAPPGVALCPNMESKKTSESVKIALKSITSRISKFYNQNIDFE